VLAPAGHERVLWHFSRKGETATLASELRIPADGVAPAGSAQKSFRHLWQPRLNIAWLPADKLFLRVVELPPGDPQEVAALVEFQIEKLSPLLANQTVWTFETVSANPGEPIQIILLVADRTAVEQRLTELQAVGYRPDRLELPALREFRALAATGEGITLLADAVAGTVTCLTAWWSGGRLRHISLARFADNAAAGDRLVDALRRTAWAAEVEGWHPASLEVTLLAEPALAARLDAPLRDFSGRPVAVRERLSPPELAAVCATAPAQANLVPPDVLARYRQEFVDRLWMRALGVTALVYVFLVLGYLAYLSILDYQKGSVDHQIAVHSANHTKSQQLKARLEILQEQVNLKFAALDCWKAAAEALPESMTLNSITFQRGKKVGLVGTVPVDRQGLVTEYNEALAKALIAGRPLFGKVTTKSIQGPGAGRQDQGASWSLECEINRRDIQ
jgi:hypothetical protein